MKTVFFLVLNCLGVQLFAQANNMLVYTVAGSQTTTALGDYGPATAARLLSTEGIWLDAVGNIYVCDPGNNRIRKVNRSSGIITTVAGSGSFGYAGDGGLATNAKIARPYGMYIDTSGNIYFADLNNNVIRRVDASSGIINTFAGGGTSLGDNGLATNAQINAPQNVYGDLYGNIYICEAGRIRKVNGATKIITTIAGNGIPGLSGDGGAATSAQVSSGVAGLAFDVAGNLYLADRTNDRIRKISNSGIITTVAGSTLGYSGDGGLATNAKLAGPIGIAIDSSGNLIIADNANNFIRKVNAATGIITTIAGVGKSATGSFAEGTPATAAEIHPEFLYLDSYSGTIYYSNWNTQVHKIVNYDAKSSYGTDVPIIECGETSGVTIFPNPVRDELCITGNFSLIGSLFEIRNWSGVVVKRYLIDSEKMKINLGELPVGVYYVIFGDQRNSGNKIFVKYY